MSYLSSLFPSSLEDLMKPIFVLTIIILAGALTGCNLVSPATPTITPTTAPTLEFKQPTAVILATPALNQTPETLPSPHQPPSSQQAAMDRAFLVVSALKDNDMAALASYVSPQMGLRFSPYAAVQETYQVFTANQVKGLWADNAPYIWGAYSGTGDTIELTFTDYYAKFVYDVDFANAPQISLNNRLGVSTTLDNSTEYYPHAMIVEFYFPGFDPTFEGMDWRSLRLVFMQENNTWYLVAVIHDQWTT